MIDVAALILATVAVGALLLVLPIVATVFAVKARRRVREMQARLDLIEAGLVSPQVAIPEATPEKIVEEPSPSPVEPAEAPEALEPPEPPEPPEPLPPVSVEETPVRAKRGSIEERIGLVWFTRIGIVLVIVALAFFFKYVIDNDWIGPWGRVAVGVIAGVFFLGWGSWMARKGKTHKIFVQGTLGLGLALLLVSAYASFAFYHLVAALPAFGVVALLSVLGGALAAWHRAEVILVLSLIAVFLNPVLLSTGVDRPWALFCYLLVMTSAGLWVAVRLNFRVAIWTAVVGVMAIFSGWYARFFDPTSPPIPGIYDLPIEEMQGAYFPLEARLAPLVFALIFPLQWTYGGILSRMKKSPRTALGLYLAAAVGAHAAFAALLFDRPVLLGVAMCVLGVGFGVLLTHERHTNWLGLPLAASFAVMASLTGEIESGKLLPLLILTGGWAAVYFATFFRRAAREGLLASGWALLLLGASGLGLAVLCGLWLLPGHFAMLGLLLAILSIVYLLLALAAHSVLTIAAAFLLSLGGMSACGILSGGVDMPSQTGFLIVSALWALAYICSLCIDMFVKGSPWSPARLFVLAGAGVGFAAIFIGVTSADAGLLRALLSLACGVVYLLVGLRMTRAGDYGANRSLLPLGLALAFFTLAVAFLFSGVGVTVIWAAEAVVLAWLAVSGRRASWLAASLVMFAIAAGRLLVVDFNWIFSQQELFWSSFGAQGTMIPTAFLNPRAIALAGTGIGMLFSAILCGRNREKTFFRIVGLGLAIAGHLALLTLAISEFQMLFTDTGGLPVSGLPSDEFRRLMDAFQQSLASQSYRLDMLATVVLAVYAAGLLVCGFVLRNLPHRIFGIVLFGVTLGKLVFWDIWELARIYQIIVLVAVGLLLLAGGFLYARFGERIKTLLADSGKLAVLLGLSIFVIGHANSAGAFETGDYENLRTIEGVTAPGDYRLLVDPALYGASRAGQADMRISDPAGTEVPFFVRPANRPPAARPKLPAKLLDPQLLPDGGSRVVLDLGPDPPRHRRVDLDIDGRDFLRQARVESSVDGRDFGILASGAYVFDLAGGGPRAVRTWLAYPLSRARYLRVTLLPGADKYRLSIRAASVTSGPLPAPAKYVGAVELDLHPTASEQRGFSLYELGKLPPGVQFDTLRLSMATRAFVRRVVVEATTRKQAWFSVGGGVIYRVPAGDDRVQELLDLPIRPAGRPLLRLSIDDGDNPPLDLQKVAAIYPPEEIVFRTTSAGRHVLYVGHKDDRGASYDLAELYRRGVPGEPRPATMGALTPNPNKIDKTVQIAAKPFSERYALVIQLVIAGVVLLLAIWTLLLIRRSQKKNRGERER